MGDVAAFSFYPGKNLGAMGEAGAVVTRSQDIADRARLLRDHGQREKYVHVRADGGNSRLDAIQAAVLDLKLPHVSEWNEARRRVAAHYSSRLAGSAVMPPMEMPYARHVYHLYVIGYPERDRLQKALREVGIGTGLHYPIPVHRQEAYAAADLAMDPLPVTDRLASTALSLPMYPHLELETADYVADQILRHVV